MVVLLLSCFPLWRGETIINKVMAGLCCSSNGTTLSLACIVPRTSIQTHNSETLMEISFVCVCAAQMGRKMWTWVNRYKELLAKVFGKSWWWDFFWGSCNVINNFLSINFQCIFIFFFAYSTESCLQVQPHCTHPAVWQGSGWSREHVTGGCAEAVKIIQKCNPVDFFLHCSFFKW